MRFAFIFAALLGLVGCEGSLATQWRPVKHEACAVWICDRYMGRLENCRCGGTGAEVLRDMERAGA